jgi:choline dehydrogenase
MPMNNFDYIIIGAGSAGCVLANRLSADLNNKVLLLEAGDPDKKLEIKIPAAYANLHHSEVDWGFSTEPQKHVNNRRIYLPRGKTLGGSSSTNAMAYVRGNRADYDEWAALGNRGWSYEEVLLYFIKSEHNEDIFDDFHGKDGLLNVTHAKHFQTPYAPAFVKACTEVGIPENKDYNGAEQQGAGFFQFTIKGTVLQMLF